MKANIGIGLGILSILIAGYFQLDSKISSLNEKLGHIEDNTKDTNIIRNDITRISESTKEIGIIKTEVHEILSNRRDKQAETALQKALSSLGPAAKFNPNTLSKLSIESKMPEADFKQAVEILSSRPAEEAKLELKNQNLFTDSQIEKIYRK